MKRIVIICLMFAVVAFANAQLKVFSNGRVGIGRDLTSYSNSLLNVGIDGNSGYAASFRGSLNGIYIDNSGDTPYRYGMRIRNRIANDTTTVGLYIVPSSSISTNSSNSGIRSLGGYSQKSNFGVFGGLMGVSNNQMTSGVGVYGSATSLSTILSIYKGLYAGFFNGDVRVTGDIYGTILTPTSTSSMATRGASNAISLEEENIGERLSRVQTLQVEMPLDEHEELLSNYAEMDMNEDCEEPETFIPRNRKNIASYKYELAADQLKEFFPNLVAEDMNGNVSINYIEMIPLLLQYINELNTKIQKLESASGLSKEVSNSSSFSSKSRGEVTSISEEKYTPIASLEQNNPNPFSESTIIKMTIPSSVRSATLQIYDMSGNSVCQKVIGERDEVSITISSVDLGTGMYLYALIADGKVISTKRMIVK